MIQYLTRVSPVEVEMRVGEVHEGDAGNKQDHPWVVTVTTRIEGVITHFVPVGQVVHVVFFFPGVAACVGRERVRVAVEKQQG